MNILWRRQVCLLVLLPVCAAMAGCAIPVSGTTPVGNTSGDRIEIRTGMSREQVRRAFDGAGYAGVAWKAPESDGGRGTVERLPTYGYHPLLFLFAYHGPHYLGVHRAYYAGTYRVHYDSEGRVADETFEPREMENHRYAFRRD